MDDDAIVKRSDCHGGGMKSSNEEYNSEWYESHNSSDDDLSPMSERRQKMRAQRRAQRLEKPADMTSNYFSCRSL